MRKKIIISMLLITILTACNTQTPYKQEIENKKQEEIEIKQSENKTKSEKTNKQPENKIKSEKTNKQSENKTPVEDKKKTPKIKDTDNKKSVKTKKKENNKSDKDNKNTDDKKKSDKLKDNKTENKKTIKEDKPSNNNNKTSNTDYKETTYTSDNSNTIKEKPNTSKENTYTYKETPNKETNTETQTQPKPKKKTHTNKKADNTPKVMTVTTERETIPAEHIKIYKPEWTPAEAPKYPDRRKDGYYEYEVTTYSDGTQTRKLINTVDPVNYTEFIGTRDKLKESTTESDGTFRPNQLIYKYRERIFTILPYHDYDNGMTVINNNEVAAYGNTADVNDNESTYYAGHFDSVFKDIREEGQIGDEIIITDEYGQTAYYRISDIFYYSVGSQVNGTPAEYYYRSSGKEQIQIQTCQDATQSTYIIYTADKM